MLMSKSRLEKFLYALYSLDSSDLPNPLSRIEELYKCLVTGDEAPTFEPLSRVEKYLMGILGGYDVELLPNPLSGVEVLLHKLATGDDNLDDVKSFLSEHEELLAEIIRNGGVGGNIDIEYVLYTLSTEFNTLYNTAEKPVKSAILKGQTLVNHFDLSKWGEQERITLVADGTSKTIQLGKPSTVKADTKYLTIIPIYENTINNNFSIGGWDYYEGQPIITINDGTGIIKKIETTRNTDDRFHQGVYMELWRENTSGQITFGKPMLIEYQDGMENWDIPYFEGMQSVKMPVLTTTGKNLFDKNKSTSKYYIDGTGNYVTSGSGNFINQTHHINNNRSVSVSYSERIGAAYVRLAEFDKNNNFIRRTMVGDNGNLSFNLNTNTYYIVASVDYNNNYFTDLQIEFSPVATSYKPFKSNILTVNEEVELRGTDNVKDELDLTTGKLTQRTIQIPLNSDYFNFSRANNSDQTNTIRWQLMFKDDFIANSIKVGSNGKCNIIDYYKGGGADKECIFIHPSAFPNRLQIKQLRTDTRFTTSEELELFLLENQAYVVLELATESVKTVDLSVVNQDRNDTKLSTFNDITHVTISSEGLIPEAELEVATKNEEDLEDSIVYTTHILSEEFNTLYNTAEKPVKSAILKGNTKYRDIDTGDILDTFDETKNLELVLVKMPVLRTTGKNLLRLDDVKSNSFNGNTVTKIDNGFNIKTTTTSTGWNQNVYMRIKVEPNTTYVYSVLKNVITDPYANMSGIKWGSGYAFIKGTQTDHTLIEGITANNSRTNLEFNTGMNKEIIIYHCALADTATQIGEFELIDFQLEENSTGTSYEPYKSNILSTPSDLELREIGDVKDELNLLTGELTRRIGEVVLDGSETIIEWENTNVIDGIKAFSFRNCADNNTTNVNSLSDTYITYKSSGKLNMANGEGISITANHCYLKILTSKLETSDIDGLKKYLSQNPITVQYELAEESVKTVDLSVVDQDGDNTKLSTFNDITHVTLSSEGLIPEAELEVAEKVPEVAASMLTISREQEVIDTTTNEQSENVDATMIATTEIYEGLL